MRVSNNSIFAVNHLNSSSFRQLLCRLAQFFKRLVVTRELWSSQCAPLVQFSLIFSWLLRVSASLCILVPGSRIQVRLETRQARESQLNRNWLWCSSTDDFCIKTFYTNCFFLCLPVRTSSLRSAFKKRRSSFTQWASLRACQGVLKAPEDVFRKNSLTILQREQTVCCKLWPQLEKFSNCSLVMMSWNLFPVNKSRSSRWETTNRLADHLGTRILNQNF